MDDIWSMPARRFFQFAYRIAAYDGMLARRIQAENDDRPAEPGPASLSRAGARPASTSAGRMPMSDKSARVLPLSAFAAKHGALVERVKVPRQPPTEQT